jgi:Cys-tRNA(Pro)/Cys-tRNA(Cys) deacylase
MVTQFFRETSRPPRRRADRATIIYPVNNPHSSKSTAATRQLYLFRKDKWLHGYIMKQIHPRVSHVLEQSSYRYVVHRHEDTGVSINGPADFARALGVDLGRITKTLFLVEHVTECRHALLCCSSTARVDFKAAARALGYGRLGVAAPDALAKVLGYPPHGVSPLGAPETVPVLIDESLLSYPSVFIGAGEAAVEVELSPTELKDIAQATIGRFTKI